MSRKRGPSRVERGLVELRRAKLAFGKASDRASREVRSCEGCDARCCRAGLNSMKVSRIEALLIARRLAEPDLAPEVPGILRRAEEEIGKRGLDRNPDATYDCPLLSAEGRCLVHGPAQPSGCLTFLPLADGGCDHDLDLFHRHHGKVGRAEKRGLGKRYPPISIPEALVKVLRR